MAKGSFSITVEIELFDLNLNRVMGLANQAVRDALYRLEPESVSVNTLRIQETKDGT